MGKLDDIRAMREAKYEREQKRSGGVRPEADGASARSVGGKPSRPRGGQRAIPSPDISDTGGQDVGSQHPEGVRGKFDRTAYQRKYMKDTYRPRVKAKREAELAELKRLRELVGEK